MIDANSEDTRRLWKSIDRQSENKCWMWTGYADKSGTGRWSPGKSSLSKFVVRAVYELTHGDIPEGKRVKHTCIERLCCNPSHLVLSSGTEERFWSFVDKTPGHGPNGNCWLFTSQMDKHKYGQFKISRGKNILAHRYSLILKTGVDHPDLCAAHICDVPRCVNPDHLFWATHKENQQDMTRKGRGRIGNRNGRAKLTEQDVIEIKRLLAAGEMQKDVAKQFGVYPTVISKIHIGKLWKHIDF